jgi:hypothetical protein
VWQIMRWYPARAVYYLGGSAMEGFLLSALILGGLGALGVVRSEHAVMHLLVVASGLASVACWLFNLGSEARGIVVFDAD